MKRIEKGWGHELIWAEGPGYTGKVLHFDRVGSKFSMHYHLEKHETWLVTKGSFVLVTIDTVKATRQERALNEGDVWENTPGLPHQLMARSSGAEVVEISTPDDPLDNYRIEPGDSQEV